MPAAVAQLAPRRSSDTAHVCAFGNLLINLRGSTGLANVNGRAPGDTLGAAAHVSSHGSSSVLKYGMVSRALLPAVSNFVVLSEGTAAISDHCVLVCTLDQPVALPHGALRAFTPITAPCVQWDPDKRDVTLVRCPPLSMRVIGLAFFAP